MPALAQSSDQRSAQSAVQSADARASARASEVFRSLGILKGEHSRWRVFKPASNSLSARSGRVSSAANVETSRVDGPINFEFSGYSSTRRQRFEAFLTRNLPRIAQYWGAPAPEQAGKTVQVIGNDEFDSAYVPTLPTTPGGGTIYYRYDTEINETANFYNFLSLVLTAWQGPRVPSYDFYAGSYIEPWLYGPADAVALQIIYEDLGSPANFDPSLYAPYVLPVYDFFNRPELGGPFVFSPDDADYVVPDFRLATLSAAFFKVLIEKPTAFAEFNQALYGAVPARTAINPNRLRQLLAGVVPEVEGLQTLDWLRRQHVLDTSLVVGPKLFVVTLPLQSNDNRDGIQVFAEAFQTNSDATEEPLSGTGTLNAFDTNNQNLRASSRELTASTALPFEDFGQASRDVYFDATKTPALVRLEATFGQSRASTLFPVGVAADAFYGGVSGANSGTLQLQVGTVTENVGLSNGVFRSQTAYPSAPRVQSRFTLGERVWERNTAWEAPDSELQGAGFLLEGGESFPSFEFVAPSGTSVARMISFPFLPRERDEAEILDLNPQNLPLARYRPELAPLVADGDALKFGIEGDRHEFYPFISQPPAPGRGYWLGVGGHQTTIEGQEPPRDRPFEIELRGGWNQVGPPFNRSFTLGSLQVRFGSDTFSFAEAQARGLVGYGVWNWLPNGGYERVDTGAGTMEPFVGYYVFAGRERGVQLVFDPNASSTTLAAARGWSVGLSASGLRTRDRSARFGVSDEAPNVAGPPTGTRVVTLRFDGAANSNAAQSGSGLAELFAPALDGATAWNFKVDGAAKRERVTLAWGDLGSVPSGVELTLRDLQSGRRLTMRRGGRYRFTSTGQPHHFEITATVRVRSQLRVRRAPSLGIEATLRLDGPASGVLEVRSRDGQTVVRRLFEGSLNAGDARFEWDGRDASGRAVAPDTYALTWSFSDGAAGNRGSEVRFRLR